MKLQWKIICVNKDDLESTLNDISEADWEVFGVHSDEMGWVVISRKTINESSSKSIGFSPPPR